MVLDCGGTAPAGGMITTSWKTPPRGSETTTNAGELLTVPVAQLGWQSLTVKVPLPFPLLFPQNDQVMVDIETSAVQPTSIVLGRTWDFDPGLHESTDGTLATGNGGVGFVVLVAWDTEATEASVTTLPAEVDGAWELIANPTPNPMPSAARTTATRPVRRAVLRRRLITGASRFASEGEGALETRRDLEFRER